MQATSKFIMKKKVKGCSCSASCRFAKQQHVAGAGERFISNFSVITIDLPYHGKTRVLLKDVAHMLNMEKGSKVNNLITGFLKNK